MATQGDHRRNRFSRLCCSGLAIALATGMLLAVGCDTQKPSLEELGELQFDSVPHLLDPEDVQRMIPDLPEEPTEEESDIAPSVASPENSGAPDSPAPQVSDTTTEAAPPQ